MAESLRHGAIANNMDVEIKWLQAEDVNDDNAESLLKDVDGF